MVEAPVIGLLDVKGLKGAKAAQLTAAMEIARRVVVPTKRGHLQIKGTNAAADYLRERLNGLPEEQFRVLYLNRRKGLLDDALIAQGAVDSVHPPLRSIIAYALQVNASALIAGHNHPSGAGFYSIEYGWKKGNKPKRGEFSPDFFIKQGDSIFVMEIKGDEEIPDPSPENIKKHEFAAEHFKRLNEWLEKEEISKRYQFNMLSPRDFNKFFQNMRNGELAGFRSELDVAITGAAVQETE